MTVPPAEPQAREQAQEALRAALAAAAGRALAEGIPPEALIQYAEERAAALRSAVEPVTTGDRADDSSMSDDGSAKNPVDRLDEVG